MADISYTYLITDFPNQSYNSDTLSAEIRASTIVRDLLYINGWSAYVDIHFYAVLGSADQDKLDNIVATHQGNPEPGAFDEVFGSDVSIMGILGVYQGTDFKFFDSSISELRSLVIGPDGSLGQQSLSPTRIYVDSSLAQRDASITSVINQNITQDSSITWIINNMTPSSLTFAYVDGSLAQRDASIASVINQNIAQDSSIAWLDSYRKIQDASIATLEASTGAYGIGFQYSQDLSETSTTANTWPIDTSTVQTKCLITTPSNFLGGLYKITGSYAWNKSATSNDMSSRIIVDGSMVGDIHLRRMNNTSNWDVATRIFFVNLSAGIHNIALQFSATTSGTTSMRDSNLEILRVQ